MPIEEYKANLETIVRHVWKAHPEARVLLITPPPIHEVLTVHGFRRYLTTDFWFVTLSLHEVCYFAGCLTI